MTCQILDPTMSLWRKASYGEPGPLLSFATDFLAEVARGAQQERES